VSEPSSALIAPYYLKLLHGNLRRLKTEDLALLDDLRRVSRTISDDELNQLLAAPNWRARLCGAWFIGLSRRTQFVGRLGALLLESAAVYAAQGYSLALALIGGHEPIDQLQKYLGKHLSDATKSSDLGWALGALHYLDPLAAREHMSEDLWRNKHIDPLDAIRDFRDLVAFIRHSNLS
jgi:hypothetical protein